MYFIKISRLKKISEILRVSVLRINPRLVERDIILFVELYVGLNYT